MNRRSLFSNNSKKGTGYFVLWAFLSLFSVFYIPLDGDNYTDIALYNNYISNGVEHHLEPLYFWIMSVLPHSFFLYRFVVWGTAALFVVLTFKQLGIESQFSTIVFTLVCLLPCFYYLRNALGFSILYYVVTCILTHRKGPIGMRIRNYCIWGALLYLSYLTHTSMPLYYLIVLVAIFLPLNKYVATIFFIGLPVLGTFLMEFANIFMIYVTLETAEAGVGYLEKTEGYDFSMMGLAFQAFMLAPYIYSMYIATKDHIFGKDASDKNLKFYLMATMVLFSSSFLFMGKASYSLHLRLLNTSFMPMAFFMALYFKNRRTEKNYKIIMTLILVYNFMQIYGIIRN